jgi:hypothetical protein
MLETATVLSLADHVTPRLRCPVLLGGFAGLRTGELLGLHVTTSILSIAP